MFCQSLFLIYHETLTLSSIKTIIYILNILLKVQLYWAVVTSQYLRVNLSIPKSVLEIIRGNKVVNTPTCILFSCLKSVRPPGIYIFKFRIKESEAVYITRFQELCHFPSVFNRKTCISTICLWILKIYLLMGYIQVSTKYNRFIFL